MKSDFDTSPGEFLPLRVDNLAEKMDLEDRGRENGKADQPESSSEAPDAVEQEIIRRIREVATNALSRLSDQLATYNERLSSIDPTGSAATMQAIGSQSENGFRAKVVQWQTELSIARKEMKEREEAIEAFKSENNLRRPPNPPKNSFVMVAVLAVLFLLETIPSAIMIAPGDEGGLLGGFVYAILYTLIGMSCGFSAGRVGLTNTGHNKLIRRMFGWVATAIFLAGAFLVSLSLAHVRGAVLVGHTSQEAAVIALSSMRYSTFDFADTNSVLLIVLGIFCALIAMFEGWVWQDPYPGYAARMRNQQKARSTFQDLVERSLEDLKEVEERFIEEIRAEQTSLRERRMQMPRILEERKRLIQKYKGHIDHLQDAGRALLLIYRDANKRARTTPAPKYFSEAWVLEGFEPPVIDDNAYSFPEASFSGVDEALTGSIQRLQDAYRQSIEWVEKLAAEAREA